MVPLFRVCMATVYLVSFLEYHLLSVDEMGHAMEIEDQCICMQMHGVFIGDSASITFGFFEVHVGTELKRIQRNLCNFRTEK